MSEEKNNTDIELWRSISGDCYSPSIHVTENGGIGMNIGGHVIVKSIKEWHQTAFEQLQSNLETLTNEVTNKDHKIKELEVDLELTEHQLKLQIEHTKEIDKNWKHLKVNNKSLNKGKQVNNKGWVKGDLIQKNGRSWIIVEFETPKSIKCGGLLILATTYEVIPDSVGQSTGQKDKKGVEIYSGDLTIDSKGNEEFVEKYKCAWILRSFHKRYKGWRYLADVVVEIIGNTTDTPSLLEEKK